MGGDCGDDWCSPDLSRTITLVLVGKVGSGKSATGNSILGCNAFASKYSYSSVTQTCQMWSTTLPDDSGVASTIHVIDTPGLYDLNMTTEDARKEIIKCMDLSKDGIHAMLMVFSAATRFSQEDADSIKSIKTFFGDKIVDHMILVFTHGDHVGGEAAWRNMMANKGAEYVQEMVKLCGNRVVLFDNCTGDSKHQQHQRKNLLAAVDSVILRNGGLPFSNQMFTQIKEAHDRQKVLGVSGYSADETSKSNRDMYDEYLTHVTNMVEEKLNSTVGSLQKQLLEEQNARLEVENEVAGAMLRSEEEIRRLRESLENAQRENDKAREENKNYRESEEARQAKEEETKKKIHDLEEDLKNVKLKSEEYRQMYEKKCIIL